MENNTYKINPKENFYFSIRLIISLIGYLLILMTIISLASKPAILFGIIFYGGFIALLFFISSGILVGHIRGNAIKITKTQFPDIYAIIERYCEMLEIDIPSSYILQSGGVLNAFATKFIRRNYVVIYSEILELAYDKGEEALKFVIAHELGHVKRKHMTKKTLLFPSAIIPFLALAYSRACEYTCDNIGKSLSPIGAINGVLILAVGKQLYKKVNAEEYIKNEQNETSFWKWFAEKISSHPLLPKRLSNIGISQLIIPKEAENEFSNQITKKEDDYNRFMPR